MLITRPVGQGEELAALVRGAGGQSLSVPVVAIADPPSWQPLDDAIARADTYDWIVFASANGVRAFAARLRAAGRDARALGTARLAAIGPATHRGLEAVGLVCDLTPADFRSEGLAEAFGRIGSGQLVMVGDGPLRAQVEATPGVKVVGRVPHGQVARWMAAADIVCQPSLVESFGQATLEAMACARTVLATRNGGPPEFVTPEAGVLVDPLSTGAILEGLSAAAAMPSPNPAARAAAEGHGVDRQAERVEALLRRVSGTQGAGR